MRRTISLLVLALALAAPAARAQNPMMASKVYLGTARCVLSSGSGSPEGVVTAPVCSTYYRTDTGTIYSKTSGTGNTGWTAQTTGGVTGSGTTNTLPKWTGASVLGDSVVQESGGFIGVNTVPSVRFHVKGTSDEVGRFESSGNPYVSLYSGATRRGYFYANTGTATLASEVGTLALSATSTTVSGTLGVSGAATFTSTGVFGGNLRAASFGPTSMYSNTDTWRSPINSAFIETSAYGVKPLFRFDVDIFAYADQNSSLTVTSSGGLSAGEISYLFGTPNGQVVDLFGKTSPVVVTVTGGSYGGTSYNSHRGYVSFHYGTVGGMTNLKIEVYKSSAWTTIYDAAPTAGAMVGTTIMTNMDGIAAYLNGARFTFTFDPLQHTYIHKIGVINPNETSWQWVLTRSGGTVYGPVTATGNLATGGTLSVTSTSSFTGNGLFAAQWRGNSGTSVQTTAAFAVRGKPDSFEWGHTNGSGYGNTIGYYSSAGNGYIAFNAEAGTNANTFKTRGVGGSVLRSNLSGGFVFGNVATASADNQTVTDTATLAYDGKLALIGNVNAVGNPNSWGVTVGTATGAVNAVMGTSTAATWLVSGTSGGTFRSGIQALDAGGVTRFYTGSTYVQHASATDLFSGVNTSWSGTAAVTGAASFSSTVGHPSFVSQTSNWRITAAGAADLRYAFVDELHAKAFIADLEQALAGGQIISKSVSPVALAVACPALGGAATLKVEDLPGAPDMQVFQSGDSVVLRTFSRSAGSLTIGDCVGQVTSYVDQSNGLQNWTFTRYTGASGGAMTAGTTVPVGSLALDYGVSGNGFYEVSAVDGAWGANAPYSQVVTWTTAPTSGNKSVRTRTGKLTGITGTADEFGFIGGDYANKQYIRASSSAVELHGVNFSMWDGGTEVIKLDRTAPSFALGSPVPTSYSSGVGVYAGKVGAGEATSYRFRVGDPAGYGFWWDGSNISWTGLNTSLSAAGVFTATNAVLSGSITASSGTIGGFTIGANSLYSGSGGTRVGLDGTTGTVRFWAGSETPTAAPFRVTESGALTATSATITGAVTATSGAIGGWTLGATSLTDTGGLVGLSSAVTAGDDVRFWAGHATPTSAPFRVTEAGALVATNASLTGNLTLAVDSAFPFSDDTKRVRWMNGATMLAQVAASHVVSGPRTYDYAALQLVQGANVWGLTVEYKDLANPGGLIKLTAADTSVTGRFAVASTSSFSDTAMFSNAKYLSGWTTGAALKSLIGVSASDKVHIDDDAVGTVMDGTLSVAGVTTLLGGSSLGLTVRSNGIQTEEYNGADGISINYSGYANGILKDRSLSIYDGKHNRIAVFDGSTGGVYADGNVSALSFTDRTPFPDAATDALAQIAAIAGDGKGGLDHTTLPAFARKKIRQPLTTRGGKAVEEDGRDLGAMISILTLGVQQAIPRLPRAGELAALEARIAVLEQLLQQKGVRQ